MVGKTELSLVIRPFSDPDATYWAMQIDVIDLFGLFFPHNAWNVIPTPSAALV